MPLSSNYLVYVTQEKYIRTNVLREILQEESFVVGHYYIGDERLIRSPNKIYEELDEIFQTFQNVELHQNLELMHRELVKEIADTQNALRFILKQLPEEATSERGLSPAIARAEWDSQRHLLHEDQISPFWREKLKELAVATRQGLEMFMKRPDINIIQEEVDTAAALKLKRLGQLEGWAITKVALKRDFKWLDKFTPDHGWHVDASGDFTIERSLTLDTINSVTPPG